MLAFVGQRELRGVDAVLQPRRLGRLDRDEHRHRRGACNGRMGAAPCREPLQRTREDTGSEVLPAVGVDVVVGRARRKRPPADDVAGHARRHDLDIAIGSTATQRDPEHVVRCNHVVARDPVGAERCDQLAEKPLSCVIAHRCDGLAVEPSTSGNTHRR